MTNAERLAMLAEISQEYWERRADELPDDSRSPSYRETLAALNQWKRSEIAAIQRAYVDTDRIVEAAERKARRALAKAQIAADIAAKRMLE